MKRFFENVNFKKSLAVLLLLATLLVASCGKDDVSSNVDNSSSESSFVSVDSQQSAENSASDVESVADTSSESESTTSQNESQDSSEEASKEGEDNSSAEPSSTESKEPESSADASKEISDDSSEEASKDSPESSSEESSEESSNTTEGVGDEKASAVDLDKIPEYTDKDYISINDGTPFFTAAQLTVKGYEKYGELDSLGRCTAAIASLGKETMPTGDRGSISSVKPTGWIQAQYSCIKTRDLYNRSHLIAWSLAGEDANKQNLVTGTAHLNQGVMTQFEDMVLDYIRETGNHVAYRVTPLFKGNDLVCRGVQMEAYSIEDKGEGICFNVYCYNVQPGVIIDYSTGASSAEGGDTSEESSEETSKDTSSEEPITADYVLNKKSKKIHLPDCKSVADMSEKNKEFYTGPIEDLLAQGYVGCGNCLKDVTA